MQKILNRPKSGDAGQAEPTAGGTLDRTDPSSSGTNGSQPAALQGGEPSGAGAKPDVDAPVVIRDDPKDAPDAGGAGSGGTPAAGKPGGDPTKVGAKGAETPPVTLELDL